MGMKSSKAQQGAVSPIQIKFDGGLNYSQSPSQIADNELTRALNLVYNSQTGTPETRSGTSCVTATPLASPILKIYYYEKSATEKWLVCASGGKLYYLDVGAWVEIGSLNDSTTVPTFLTFNTYLLIADGGTNLKKWNGSVLSSLSDGLSATAIAEIGARVVINSKSDPDLVTFSGVEDETMWDTADLTNPAIGIRAGFGDNMLVNGFAQFGTDLIVSKRGDSEKRLYRISVADPSPVNWNVSLLTGNNCSQNPHTIVSAFNNIFMVDTNGFKSVKGVTEYGDLQVDTTGSKINVAIDSAACSELVYLPSFSAMWFIVGEKIYTATNMNGGIKFTDMMFMQGTITSILEANDRVYLSGVNGYLYLMEPYSDKDEVAPNDLRDYLTVLTTKRFSFFGGGLLRMTSVEFKALEVTGTDNAYIRANTTELNGTLLKTVRIKAAIEELYDANYDLADANAALGDMSGLAWIESTTNRVRGTSIQWQVDSTAGRFGVEGLLAEVALVQG